MWTNLQHGSHRKASGREHPGSTLPCYRSGHGVRCMALLANVDRSWGDPQHSSADETQCMFLGRFTDASCLANIRITQGYHFLQYSWDVEICSPFGTSYAIPPSAPKGYRLLATFPSRGRVPQSAQGSWRQAAHCCGSEDQCWLDIG